MNSTLINFIHKYFYLDIEKSLFQKILIESCKQLPIKQISETQQKPFELLVDQIILLKQQNKDTKKLETEIDQMVYKLYNLTADEIKIVEGE